MKKLKILEVTAFSAGICGLWARVSTESMLLSKRGYEVHIFSSNIFRGEGSKKIVKKYENRDNIKITRFPTRGSFGRNTFFWSYKKEAYKFKPDIIIVHAYRQYYSTLAVKIAQKLKIPCILVTHAPFLRKNLRNWRTNLVVQIYDKFIGKRILNRYDKIFSITHWEIPYLKRLRANPNKIIYVPNGIPEEFFTIKIPNFKKNKEKQILFLGRIAPIKDIETLIRAFNLVSKQNPRISLKFVGPTEKDYEEKIRGLIERMHLSDKIIFSQPVYDLNEKIRIIDEADIFILPSKREGMPQALIEAMSRKKIVISSKTDGGKEIIKDKENGYLFEIGDYKELSEKIFLALQNNKENLSIREKAQETVKQFSWEKIINNIEKTIKKEMEKRI